MGISTYTSSNFFSSLQLPAALCVACVPVIYAIWNATSSSASNVHLEKPKPSDRMKKTERLLQSYSALTPEALLSNFSPSFTHKVLPTSLNIPSRDKKEFAQHAQGFTELFTSFSMTAMDMFEDPVKDAVVVHARMKGELAALGPWENECILVIRFEGSEGGKVVELREFVDSARANLLREKLTKHFSQGKAEELMAK